MSLRQKLRVEGEPTLHPVFRFMQRAAFWQHWNLHPRNCDLTGQSIISVFGTECPYPVWHKDEWVKHANPPQAVCGESGAVFPQMWALFQQCPIAHNMGAGNQNCEYTDDAWYSKNCYLFHSALGCEDCRYSYRNIRMKDSIYSTYSFESERTCDFMYSMNCFDVKYALHCRDCNNCAFIYDCRGCTDCLLCCNLRNKKYCFGNQQYSKEAYEKIVQEWNIASYDVYQKAEQAFGRMMREQAWHRALFIDRSEACTGNYVDHSKNLSNCFFVDDAEDCVNVMRTTGSKDCLDCLSPAVKGELIYCSCTCQDQCYGCRYCYDLISSQHMEYCAHCFQCRNCFGCCGLVGKEYCIFNKPYSKEEYEEEKNRIIHLMQQSGEYGRFFPGHFAANPYEESLAGFHWPLDESSLERYGFRKGHRTVARPADARDIAEIPADVQKTTPELASVIFWDESAQRPFQIQQADIAFSRKLQVPLPHSYYMRRIRDNFAQIPFNGALRTASCGACTENMQTSWPAQYDGRILCENCYLKEVY